MSIGEYRKKEIRNFLGAWQSPDEISVPANRGRVAENVQFGDDFVETRHGYAPEFVPLIDGWQEGDPPVGDIVTSMFNWVYAEPKTGPKNYLLWSSLGPPQGHLRYADLDAQPPVAVTSYPTYAYAASYAGAGSSVIVGHYNHDGRMADSDGDGFGEPGRIVGFYGPNGEHRADELFQRPLFTTEISITVNVIPDAGGLLTAGTHRLGVIFEAWNGYIGRPSPVTNADPMVFQPVSFSVSGTPSKGEAVLSPFTAWPSWAKKARLVMTTSLSTTEYFFIPGAEANVVAGSITIPFNIEDASLAKNAISATAHLTLMTQSNTGKPPISPIFVFEYRHHTGYVVNDSRYGAAVFFSDEGAPQAINLARSIQQLPGQRQIIAAFELGSTCYLLGPHWTYSIEDTGGDPATWPSPALVDRTIGALGPRAFAVNVALGAAWVGSASGLYRFTGGHYDPLPVSFKNDGEWQKINPDEAIRVSVLDDAVRKVVKVLVPYGPQEAIANTQLTWDYSPGTEHTEVNYSRYTLPARAYTVQPYAEGVNAQVMVQSPVTKRLEQWLGPGIAGNPFLRERRPGDPDLYLDGLATASIATYYDTALMFAGKGASQMTQHHGAMFRLEGAGTVVGAMIALDGKRSVPIGYITLREEPGEWYLRQCYLVAEDVRWHFEMAPSDFVTDPSVRNSWFRLSGITHLWLPHSEKR